MRCPVPGCVQEFPTLKRLAAHLKGSIRRNRCGTYTEHIAFTCTCGSVLSRVDLIYAHSLLHSRRIYRDQSDLPESLADSFEIEDDFSSEDEGDDRLDVDRNVEDVSVGGEDPDMEDIIFLFDGLDHEVDSVSSSSSSEESEELEPTDPITIQHTPCIIEGRLPPSILFELYRYCLEVGCTNNAYKLLRRLPIFEGLHTVPLNLKDLRRQVEQIITSGFSWPHHRTISICHDRKSYDAPYLSVGDCLSIWLSIPSILSAVRQWRDQYLPKCLVDRDEFDLFSTRRSIAVESGEYFYENVADGSLYLDNIRSAIPLFEDNYLQAMEDGIEVVVCHVGYYEDDFSKNLNSLVSQTLCCLTLVEATVGESSLTGLSSLIMMLCDSKLTKGSSADAIRRNFVEQMRMFERGVRMVVNGVECLVICFCLLLLGDTPALKTICGMSPSVSAACYVRMPCMICEILMENLSTSITDPEIYGGIPRSLDTLRGFLQANGYETGAPASYWLKEVMKQFGFLRISEFVRLHNQPSSIGMGIDSMHAIFRGALVKHFIKLIKKLTTGEGVLSRKWRHIWQRISSEFSQYCRLNGISAFWNFSSKKQFKMRMTAGSVREFARVSGDILRKIGLIANVPRGHSVAGLNHWRKQIRSFNYWCIHIKIASMVDQHRISSAEVNALQILINKLLCYFCEDFGNSFITINVHYYSHFVDKFRCLGPMRIVANNSREHLIQKIKPFYRNTNHRQKEASVFSRYTIGLFFSVYDIFHRPDTLHLSRNAVPEGVIDFDFYIYDSVTVNSLNETRVIIRDNYHLLDKYRYSNSAKVRYKLDFCVLRPGHYIYISGTSHVTAHVGKLVAIVRLNDEAFLAYTRPLDIVSVDENESQFYYKPWKIRTSAAQDLYISPTSSFICRLYAYLWGEYTSLIRWYVSY